MHFIASTKHKKKTIYISIFPSCNETTRKRKENATTVLLNIFDTVLV
jgi:hypothetical protein